MIYYEKLDDFIYGLSRWGNENLGKPFNHITGQITGVSITKDELYIESLEYDSYEEGYTENTYSCPLDKLLNDDWKEPALKEYQKKLEKKQEEQRIKEETLAQETEAKERAEYERLKAKYGN